MKIEALAEWMRGRGFNPLKGCVLLWPVGERAPWGKEPPEFVRYSRILTRPVLADKPGRWPFTCRSERLADTREVFRGVWSVMKGGRK